MESVESERSLTNVKVFTFEAEEIEIKRVLERTVAVQVNILY